MKKDKHTKEEQDVLRDLAFKLKDAGLTSEQVGSALGIKKMTVAGWLSHRAMGKYKSP